MGSCKMCQAATECYMCVRSGLRLGQSCDWEIILSLKSILETQVDNRVQGEYR